MKNLLLSVFSLFLFINLSASELILIKQSPDTDQKTYFSNPALQVHYYNDDVIVASKNGNLKNTFTLLDETAFGDGENYFLFRIRNDQESYSGLLSQDGNILYETEGLIIYSLMDSKLSGLKPPADGSMLKIDNITARLPQSKLNFNFGKDLDPFIIARIAEVDTNVMLANLQQLQDYGTRNCYKPQSVEAQNWIKAQFESYGLTAQLFDFNMPQGNASDNVIATKVGTIYPDEYVVLGSHYDSYAFGGGNNEPGADDNASGTVGILEVARLLAPYDFDRTIIFCTFSGEEYGLYGSDAYATWAANQGMDILGYLNMDMISYRHPGDPIHTDVIAPVSAQPLKEYYTQIANMYLPDFIVESGALTGGDSDHTSFNQNGYMGIFPFEDSQNYSPYIHSGDDVIGLSVNSLEMAMNFTQAILATTVSMANMITPPQNLVAVAGNNQVELSWDPMAGIDYFNIYRNNGSTPIGTSVDPSYIDTDVQVNQTYEYYVTAIYTGTGEESDPSNTVSITLLPPMAFPFIEDFETGTDYWTMEGSWGLSSSVSHSTSHSLTESPSGQYQNDLNISANLYGFSLENKTDATISFWTRYSLEEGYDYVYFQVSTNGEQWITLEEFNGSQNSWIQKTYNLYAYLDEPYVALRFNFYSDEYVTEDGFYVDDINLEVTGGTTLVSPNLSREKMLQISPNPFSENTVINYLNSAAGQVKLTLLDSKGQLILTLADEYKSAGKYTYTLNASGFTPGLYLLRVQTATGVQVSKLTVTNF